MANVTITLDRNDLGQILDGLMERMESYAASARCLEEGDNPDNIILEDVRDEDEAQKLADGYKRIIDAITRQISI